MRLAIFSEAGFSYGFGHFYRMSGICEFAIKNGGQATLYLMADETARCNLGREYVEFVNWKDPEVYATLLDSETILVVDSYHVDIEELEEFKKYARDMIIIDDNIRLDYHDMKILNPNYFAVYLDYPADRNNELFLGKDYTLIRDEFTPDIHRNIKEKVTDILITMGGTDPLGRTAALIKMIKLISDGVRLHVVCTKAYNNLEDIHKALSETDRLYMNIDAVDMSKLMRTCDFAVASAGQTTNELIKTLCPAILVVAADNQLLNTRFLSTNGFISAMYEDDKELLAEMFSSEKRRKLFEKNKTFRSDKSGKEFIFNVAFGGGNYERQSNDCCGNIC